MAKTTGRESGFGVVSFTYDFWPKAQAAGQSSEWFWPPMIFGQQRRPRVWLPSSFGHLRLLAKSACRGSGFGVVLVTYDVWSTAQAAGQASEYFNIVKGLLHIFHRNGAVQTFYHYLKQMSVRILLRQSD